MLAFVYALDIRRVVERNTIPSYSKLLFLWSSYIRYALLWHCYECAALYYIDSIGYWFDVFLLLSLHSFVNVNYYLFCKITDAAAAECLLRCERTNSGKWNNSNWNGKVCVWLGPGLGGGLFLNFGCRQYRQPAVASHFFKRKATNEAHLNYLAFIVYWWGPLFLTFSYKWLINKSIARKNDHDQHNK